MLLYSAEEMYVMLSLKFLLTNMVNRGKQFESIFMRDWKISFPHGFIFRLKDDVSGLKYAAGNPCDFICYNYPLLFLIETKTTHGNTFPFTSFPQYERLLSFKGIPGVVVGVVIWFVDKDKLIFVPIEICERIKLSGAKSINIRSDIGVYPEIVDISFTKQRVFLKGNYTDIFNKYLEV